MRTIFMLFEKIGYCHLYIIIKNLISMRDYSLSNKHRKLILKFVSKIKRNVNVTNE